MPSVPAPPSDHVNKNDVKDKQKKEEGSDLEITRQDGSDGSGSNGSGSDNENGSTDTNDINNVTIFELLDDLISHMNTTKNIFTLLILSSFILAPIALIVAGIFVLHPFFLYRILFRLPAVGGMLLLFISVSIMLASVWLFIGASEQRFFSHWNKKFNRYVSKMKQVDKELGQ
ncbi:MAG TPA: hypothetical protein VFJ51_09895 [Nitrososphaeraceae archaeon]|nr:hypothetical protein [Nitrososphaeraceae archaeon]